MSYNALDYAGDDGMTACDCGEKHSPAYRLTKCGHDGCTTLTCYRCVTLCAGCGTAMRCEEHAYRTTYRGSLKTPVSVCSDCRNAAESEEAAEESEAQVE